MDIGQLITAELDEVVLKVQPVSGGDICESFRVSLADGQDLFVKTRPHCPPDMFSAEARGLRWLEETETLRIPRVVTVTERLLALEFLQAGSRCPGYDEILGQGLAQMHRFPVEGPGLDHDNFIGPLNQPNQACQTWPEFFAERRLRLRLQEAIDEGFAPQSWAARFEKLFSKLPEIIPDEPLSRLHGDLWGGNLHTTPEGDPCLIDPAVYAGHREVDLAMMRLFGGFSARVFESYQETWPLLEGHTERIPLYQLYPLLVHVVLFGSGYVPSVERALKPFVR